MVVNVIYTPDTVSLLHMFLLSFLDHTSYKFRLVANGCTRTDMDLLNLIKDRFGERIELDEYSVSAMHPHYEVLNYLQSKEKGEYFSFMDSDIIALASMDEKLNLLIESNEAIFSGRPIWADSVVRPSNRKKAGGRFMIDRDGFCLGGTYFAIYQNDALSEIRDRYSMGFSNVWWEAIPQSIQKILEKMGRRFERYDNGKILNLLLQHHGYNCTFTDDLPICHFGGMSRFNSVLKKDKEKMREHEVSRSGQKDMRMIASFMSEAIDSILIGQAIDYPDQILEHPACEQVKASIEECIRLKGKYDLV